LSITNDHNNYSYHYFQHQRHGINRSVYVSVKVKRRLI